MSSGVNSDKNQKQYYWDLSKLFREKEKLKMDLLKAVSIPQFLSHKFNNSKPFQSAQQTKKIFHQVHVVKVESFKKALMLLACSLNKDQFVEKVMNFQQQDLMGQRNALMKRIDVDLQGVTYNIMHNPINAAIQVMPVVLFGDRILQKSITDALTLNQSKTLFYKFLIQKSPTKIPKYLIIHYLIKQHSQKRIKVLTLNQQSQQFTSLGKKKYFYAYLSYDQNNEFLIILVDSFVKEREWSQIKDFNFYVQMNSDQVLRKQGFIGHQKTDNKNRPKYSKKIDFSQFKQDNEQPQQQPFPQQPVTGNRPSQNNTNNQLINSTKVRNNKSFPSQVIQEGQITQQNLSSRSNKEQKKPNSSFFYSVLKTVGVIALIFVILNSATSTEQIKQLLSDNLNDYV